MEDLSNVKFPEWLPFAGTIEDSGNIFLMKAGEGEGSFEMAHEDVVVIEGKVFVRDDRLANVVEKPEKRLLIGVAEAEIQGDCVVQADCPSGCCQCIGLVRICCGGGTRGICFGAWGCP